MPPSGRQAPIRAGNRYLSSFEQAFDNVERVHRGHHAKYQPAKLRAVSKVFRRVAFGKLCLQYLALHFPSSAYFFWLYQLAVLNLWDYQAEIVVFSSFPAFKTLISDLIAHFAALSNHFLNDGNHKNCRHYADYQPTGFQAVRFRAVDRGFYAVRQCGIRRYCESRQACCECCFCSVYFAHDFHDLSPKMLKKGRVFKGHLPPRPNGKSVGQVKAEDAERSAYIFAGFDGVFLILKTPRLAQIGCLPYVSVFGI
ncbi:hypothetical protein [Inovirus D_HF34_8]|nr:hypothetical protein [Inovirus D_HF34_8]